MKLFTTGEVAKILNLPGSRIRSFVRAGFLAPARGEKKTLPVYLSRSAFFENRQGAPRFSRAIEEDYPHAVFVEATDAGATSIYPG